MFGHFASSHTVLKECSRTICLTAVNCFPEASGARSHAGRRCAVRSGAAVPGATMPDALQSRAGGANLKAALANPERQIILDALENNGWNRQETAEMLGINRTTLYKKMKKYGIQFEKQLIG